MIATIKHSWYLAAVRGLLVGVVNMFVIKLNTMLPASILFPALSAGGLVVSWLISYFVYRERFTVKQLIGFTFGLAAVILLNI